MTYNIPLPQFTRDVGDPTGGLTWIAPDGVAAGDVAPVVFSEPDSALLPMAGPAAEMVWGGDAA